MIFANFDEFLPEFGTNFAEIFKNEKFRRDFEKFAKLSFFFKITGISFNFQNQFYEIMGNTMTQYIVMQDFKLVRDVCEANLKLVRDVRVDLTAKVNWVRDAHEPYLQVLQECDHD